MQTFYLSQTIEPISATVRKPDAAARASLTDFGKYVADCLPKYVQKVQLTAGDELEVLIAPEGVIPTLQFLKDHHSAQFASLVDIAGMDVPSRKHRFEVSSCRSFNVWFLISLFLFFFCQLQCLHNCFFLSLHIFNRLFTTFCH